MPLDKTGMCYNCGVVMDSGETCRARQDSLNSHKPEHVNPPTRNCCDWEPDIYVRLDQIAQAVADNKVLLHEIRNRVANIEEEAESIRLNMRR